jgi:hypothetical protein
MQHAVERREPAEACDIDRAKRCAQAESREIESIAFRL